MVVNLFKRLKGEFLYEICKNELQRRKGLTSYTGEFCIQETLYIANLVTQFIPVYTLVFCVVLSAKNCPLE
jgi:hypothetical protein